MAAQHTNTNERAKPLTHPPTPPPVKLSAYLQERGREREGEEAERRRVAYREGGLRNHEKKSEKFVTS